MSFKHTLPCKWCGSKSVSHLFAERKPKSILRYWKCTECKNQFETIEQIASLGYACPGSSNHNSILTEEDVIQIRLKKKEGMQTKDLVKWSGMTRATIQDIVAKRTWKHV
jgi:transcriptional regulator NrdR family protein|tara:strand:- start:5233 stop:5562 length:330 start_codon:yes stop_codon:yes gene_type:complete